MRRKRLRFDIMPNKQPGAGRAAGVQRVSPVTCKRALVIFFDPAKTSGNFTHYMLKGRWPPQRKRMNGNEDDECQHGMAVPSRINYPFVYACLNRREIRCRAK